MWGPGLPAMAVYQSTHLLTDTLLSQESQLPHWFVVALAYAAC